MKLQELLPLVRQWRSADPAGAYVGIRRGEAGAAQWYYDREAVPAEVLELEVTRIEVCTGGRVVYHLRE